ncbi:MAG: CocE/NonD family hydrolase, partial [Planctomycetota bacterium]
MSCTRIATVLLAVVAVLAVPLRAQERISEFGRYEGYSTARFDNWVVTSQYVQMRDGVRLAVDVVRPAVDGVAAADPMPVIWTHSRYHRSPQELMRAMGAPGADAIESIVDTQPDLQHLVRHGYVVVAVGVRGSGASFGRFEGLFSPAETRDAVQIIEWIAGQPWCDGNVGMFGGSYLGITQYMAASQSPPALKAIFPVVAAFDMYDVIYPGGIFRDDMVRHWGDLTTMMDRQWPAPRVDGDEDGSLLAEAKADHERNWRVFDGYRATPFRDDATPDQAWSTHSPSPFLEAINRAKVPAYHWNGWHDIFITDSTIWFANYAGPQRLTIGPWPHGPTPDQSLLALRIELRTAEQHRWFDRWLKGIDNGVTDEPPVRYATVQDPGRWTWHSAATWPPPEATPVRFAFAAGPSGSVESINDGRLIGERTVAVGAGGFDEYTVDFTTTTGTTTRWDNAFGAGAM